MSSVETGQMNVDTGQMTAVDTSVLSQVQQKTSVLSQQQTSNIENWNWGLSKPGMGLSLSFVGGCRPPCPQRGSVGEPIAGMSST